MQNWNAKPILPRYLVALVFIIAGVALALLNFVLSDPSEIFLPAGLMLISMGLFILFSRWVRND